MTTGPILQKWAETKLFVPLAEDDTEPKYVQISHLSGDKAYLSGTHMQVRGANYS